MNIGLEVCARGYVILRIEEIEVSELLSWLWHGGLIWRFVVVD